MKKQAFLNTYVNNVTTAEVLQEIADLVEEKKNSFLVEVNTDVIVKMEQNAALKEAVDRAELVLVDGQPLIWVSALYGRRIQEKISGSDLIPKVCELAEKSAYSVFILGGMNGAADRAAENLKKAYPGIKIKGTYEPPFGFEKDPAELRKINEILLKAAPDILITCFGCPKQEIWIYENKEKYQVPLSICGGATVDFLAGNVNRAPKWISDHGLEWLYRFFQEPKRLFKRYFVDDMKILRLIWKYRHQYE